MLFTKGSKRRWVEVRGTDLVWSEGAREERANCESVRAAEKRRDALIGKWMAAGFELELEAPAPPPRPSLQALIARALAAAKQEDEDALEHAEEAIFEACFPDLASEVRQQLTNIEWGPDGISAITIRVDPSWLEMNTKKYLRPFLDAPLARSLRQVEILSPVPFWFREAEVLLGALGASPCAPHLTAIGFWCREELLDSTDAYQPLPKALLAPFPSLEDLELRSSLLGVEAGAAPLRSLIRDCAELTASELAVVSNGVWPRLESLEIRMRSVVLGETEEDTDAAVLKAGLAQFLSGEAFPRLKTLVLHLPTSGWLRGSLRKQVLSSPLGKRLESVDVKET